MDDWRKSEDVCEIWAEPEVAWRRWGECKFERPPVARFVWENFPLRLGARCLGPVWFGCTSGTKLREQIGRRRRMFEISGPALN